MAYPTVGESVGIEVEFASIKMEDLRSSVPGSWTIDRDGSVTREVSRIGGTTVYADGQISGYLQWDRVGGELISPIESFEEADEMVHDIEVVTRALRTKGEIISDAASVHVHLGVGKFPSCRTLKNIIRLALAIEAPMFRLSVGESSKHRGVCHNDFMYCRPITGHGPQYVRGTNGFWYEAFDIQKILNNARTAMDIIQGWCRADHQPRKWVPARYYWVHMASVFSRGTLELRCFNETLESKYILAWADLTRAIFKTATMGQVSLPMFPLGSSKPDGWKGEFRVDDFFRIIPPDLFYFPRTKTTLEELWFKSTWQPGVDPQVSHLCVGDRAQSVELDSLHSDLIPRRVSEGALEKPYNKALSWNRSQHETPPWMASEPPPREPEFDDEEPEDGREEDAGEETPTEDLISTIPAQPAYSYTRTTGSEDAYFYPTTDGFTSPR